MNNKSQLQFVKRTAALLEAGISLSQALSILIRMEKAPARIKILSSIKEGVENGISLSKSMQMSKGKFGLSLISMVSYGESSGILALSLRQSAEIIEKKNELKRKIISALIYPAFIAIATLGMALFLVLYIFPKIMPLLSSLNIKLPLLTQLVQKLYQFVVAYGIWTSILLIILSGLFIYLFKKFTEFRDKVQIGFLNIPVVSEVLRKYFIGGTCRSAGALLDCGQSLPSILEQEASSHPFESYRKALTICRIEVIGGISLSESLRSFQYLFPSLVPDMLSIGEQTGSLSAMLKEVSYIYDQELDSFTKQMGTIIEPVLMVGMGLIVGSIALSIILPIYEITNHLTH